MRHLAFKIKSLRNICCDPSVTNDINLGQLNENIETQNDNQYVVKDNVDEVNDVDNQEAIDFDSNHIFIFCSTSSNFSV